MFRIATELILKEAFGFTDIFSWKTWNRDPSYENLAYLKFVPAYVKMLQTNAKLSGKAENSVEF